MPAILSLPPLKKLFWGLVCGESESRGPVEVGQSGVYRYGPCASLDYTVSNILRVKTHSNPLTVKTYLSITPSGNRI